MKCIWECHQLFIFKQQAHVREWSQWWKGTLTATVSVIKEITTAIYLPLMFFPLIHVLQSVYRHLSWARLWVESKLAFNFINLSENSMKILEDCRITLSQFWNKVGFQLTLQSLAGPGRFVEIQATVEWTWLYFVRQQAFLKYVYSSLWYLISLMKIWLNHFLLRQILEGDTVKSRFTNLLNIHHGRLVSCTMHIVKR